MPAKQNISSVKQQHKVAKHNKDLVRRYYREAWNHGNLAVVNEIFVANHVGHDVADPTHILPAGVQSIKELVSAVRAALPDLNLTIEDLIAEQDRVAVRYIIQGTQKGELFGLPASGQPLALGGLAIHRIANGRIVESWSSQSALKPVQQAKLMSEMA